MKKILVQSRVLFITKVKWQSSYVLYEEIPLQVHERTSLQPLPFCFFFLPKVLTKEVFSLSVGGSWTEERRTVSKGCREWNLWGSSHVWRKFVLLLWYWTDNYRIWTLEVFVGFELGLAHTFVYNEPCTCARFKKGNRRQFQRQKTRDIMALFFKYFTKESDSQFLFKGGSTLLLLILMIKIMIFFYHLE